jgi:hypothetical protein
MTLAAVQFELFDPGPKTAVLRGPVDIWRLGYIWFDYGDFHGDLQYVRFDKQLFLAPNLKVTGYGYQLFPGVTGRFTTVYTKLADDPFTILGNVISAYQGKIPGLAQTLVGSTMGAPPQVTKLGVNQRRLKSNF